jgi:hypothetical protein
MATLGSYAQCTPDFTIVGGGFKPSSDLLPCATQGSAYDQTVTIQNFTVVGGSFNVDSVVIDSIKNIPCGISYAMLRKKLGPGEAGCIRFTGTTSDAAGQYKLAIWVRVYTTPDPPAGIEGAPWKLDELAALGGYDYRSWIRVKTSAGTCASLDTTRSFTGDKTSTCTTTGISNVSGASMNISLVPNPANQVSAISFEVSKESNMSIVVTNVIGEEVMNQSIHASLGENKVEIPVADMQEGIYFISIRNGAEVATRRLVVKH